MFGTHSICYSGRLRLSQGASLKPDESEGCSPVSGERVMACLQLEDLSLENSAAAGPLDS